MLNIFSTNKPCTKEFLIEFSLVSIQWGNWSSNAMEIYFMLAFCLVLYVRSTMADSEAYITSKRSRW